MTTQNRPRPYAKDCGSYLRLSNAFTIDQAAALWCDGDPGQDVALLRAAAPCFTIKHDLILQAVRGGRLPVSRDGAGPRIDASKETVNQDRMRIMRTDLVEWFESLTTNDRPKFLFDAEASELPDVSEAAAMTADRAIAVMAWIVSENRAAMSINDRPNAAAIGEKVRVLAEVVWGADVRGFNSFHKRLSQALKTLDDDTKAMLRSRQKSKN